MKATSMHFVRDLTPKPVLAGGSTLPLPAVEPRDVPLLACSLPRIPELPERLGVPGFAKLDA